MAVKYYVVALSLGLAIGSLFAAPSEAQSRGGPMFGRGGHAISRNATGRRSAGMRSRRRAYGSRSGPNYYPYYALDYYPYYDPYDSQDASDDAPPPPLRAEPAAPVRPADPPKPPEALVMELRGDHWVRLTSHGPMEVGAEASDARSGASLPVARANAPIVSRSAQAPDHLPLIVLIFRDGHQEEVAKYTIVGSTISLKSDYWSTGSWTRKIAVAELNLAATLQANQERGAKFSLPSRPSEVIVR